MKFEKLNLKPELLETLKAAGFAECTPIQEQVIPAVLVGKDVSGLAQTGTGKTAAFVIPLIERILQFRAGSTSERSPKNWRKNSFVLVLVPTRELATQVDEAIQQFGKGAGIKSTVIVGGTEYDDQRKALKDGVDFVVGTPGRVIDLYKTHSLNLNDVGACVFDEADRMFDMGFRDDMKFVLRRVPRDRHFLLFSATLNFDVINIAYEFGAEPTEFNISRDQVTAEGIEHEVLQLGQFDKPAFLLSVLKKYSPQQCMVFTNFKFNCRRIANFLKLNGIEATEMSSLLSQSQRNKVLESFKAGQKQILVATDVAARGLDIKGVDLVINFDLPDDPEGYVHRIGRTGRAGLSGRAVGFVSDRDVDALMRIEEYLKEKVKIGWIEDSELVKDFKPFPKADDDRPARPQGRGFAPRGNQRPSGPPRGPRDQQSRRPQGGTRPQQPSANNPKPEAHGQTAGHGPSNLHREHRDRKMGRHGGKPQTPRHEGNQNRGPRPQHNSNGPKRRDLNRRPAPRHGQRTHSTPAKPQSIGQKIKGLFSKLFK